MNCLTQPNIRIRRASNPSVQKSGQIQVKHLFCYACLVKYKPLIVITFDMALSDSNKRLERNFTF